MDMTEKLPHRKGATYGAVIPDAKGICFHKTEWVFLYINSLEHIPPSEAYIYSKNLKNFPLLLTHGYIVMFAIVRNPLQTEPSPPIWEVSLKLFLILSFYLCLGIRKSPMHFPAKYSILSNLATLTQRCPLPPQTLLSSEGTHVNWVSNNGKTYHDASHIYFPQPYFWHDIWRSHSSEYPYWLLTCSLVVLY